MFVFFRFDLGEGIFKFLEGKKTSAEGQSFPPQALEVVGPYLLVLLISVWTKRFKDVSLVVLLAKLHVFLMSNRNDGEYWKPCMGW